MPAPTPAQAPIEVVRVATLRIAPLLVRHDLSVVVTAGRLVEVRNPAHSRMVQDLVVLWHEGAWWWHWVWSGAERGGPSEFEPLAPVNDEPDETVRLIVNVLSMAPTPV